MAKLLVDKLRENHQKKCPNWGIKKVQRNKITKRKQIKQRKDGEMELPQYCYC
jgi:hypothetical protein